MCFAILIQILHAMQCTSPRRKGCYSYAIYHYLCVYVFSPFPPFELTCAGETPARLYSPDDRVTPSKTLLWHPRLASVAIPGPISRLASVAIPGPISRIVGYCVPLYVCLILCLQTLGAIFRRYFFLFLFFQNYGVV